MTDREAMKMALEALEEYCITRTITRPIASSDALRQALAQSERGASMNKIDLIIDALSISQNSVWSKLNEQALAAARELQAEKQEPINKMPTKIFGPNLEEILNAAGFYRQPEQEPVAWLVKDVLDGLRYPSALKNPVGSIKGESQPLYTAPPKREWVGLTDDEIEHLRNDQPWWMVRDIEAKLKEKNT